MNVPKGIITQDQEFQFKRKYKQESLQKTVKGLYSKQQYSVERRAGLNLDLRNKFQMSRSDNMLRWLQKKAVEKSKMKK